MKIFNNIIALLSRKHSSKKEEIVIISYPKSGRTWLRLMIGRILQQHFNLQNIELLELQEFTKHHPRIPYIVVSPDDRPFWKTVDGLETSKNQYRDKRVIFLARDPRDVVVSSYFQKSRRFSAQTNGMEAKEQYTGTLSDYLCEPVGGIDTLIEFYNIWANNRNVPKGFLLVRYEELNKQTSEELRRILNFINFSEVPNNVIDEAVEFASFENMRRMERNDELDSFRLRTDNQADDESYKVRKGKVRGYVDYLNSEEIDYLDKKIENRLSSFFDY